MTKNKPSCFGIGDSISVEFSPFLEAALMGRWEYSRRTGDAEARLNLDIPCGSNGGDSFRVREFLRSCTDNTISKAYDLMLINTGLHDCKRDLVTKQLQVSISDYTANLRAIITMAQQLAHQLWWLRTTAVDDEQHAERPAPFSRHQSDIDQYNRHADQLMTDLQIPIVDLASFSQDCLLPDGQKRYRDGVHFAKVVQAQQGAWLAGQIIHAGAPIPR